MSLLECRELSAGYSDRPVVRDVDLSLHGGEVVSLLGPNGAGKTTLLLTLAGLLPSLGGMVEVGDVVLAAGKPRTASKAGVVLVPDDRALFRALTTEQNLRLAARRRSDVDRILEYFPGLNSRLGVAAGQLSGGEQQMLAIGRALARHPRVLLIDELSMGLAPIVVESILPVIRRVAAEEDIAVLLVEQHVRLALGISDRAVVMAHGRIALTGDAGELLERPELIEAAYLGRRNGSRAENA
ncbi:MAG: livF 6 [Nocardia sp.]|uniref:ABC transporter ATP-binding protein n=1 Tax=Nocardia sp. TaxID=1821 RepID=UPI0026344673|nr:ATP-binding cassette domain-containing protein [Nocardia sp.]MCU1642925.1 livF 6 [Nocardia sp.]